MLNTKAVALSFTITVALFYLLCAFFANILPQGFLAFFNTWLHGIDLSIVASKKIFTLGEFLFGLVSISAVSWITGAVFSVLYNALNRISKS